MSVMHDNNDNLSASISCKLIPGSRTCNHKVGRIMSTPAQGAQGADVHLVLDHGGQCKHR